MPEPHTSTLAARARLGGSIGLTGTFSVPRPMPHRPACSPPSLFGLVASDQQRRPGRCGRLPVLSACGLRLADSSSILAGMLPAAEPSDGLRMLAAVAIGAAAPGVVPLLLTRARGIAQGDAK